jgi:5-methylcytosine-specific restriction endonuclease McrA
MERALFLNGIFKDVLDEIVLAQRNKPDLVCFLQPYSSEKIRLLNERQFSTGDSIPLYVSTTDDLGRVSYTADIVGWEDKRSIAPDRLRNLNAHIQQYQPNEQEIYPLVNGKPCTNLISVINVIRIPAPFSVANLIKVSDGSTLKQRTRAGGWSYVINLPDYSLIKEQMELELERDIQNSKDDSADIRRTRLAMADKLPEQVQTISVTYKRNPDVIVEVMIRANGKCERCGRDAPFRRIKDNTPYLEVHHWKPLSEQGEDTVENAGALCPNCHREMHFGIH